MLLLSLSSTSLALKMHKIPATGNKSATEYINKEVKLARYEENSAAKLSWSAVDYSSITPGGDWKQVTDVKILDGWNGCSLNFCDYGTKCRSVDGRNDTSCCQEHSVEILKAVSHFLDHQQLEHWLVYGLLLGAIREQNYLPWETDVDLQLPKTAWTQLIGPGPSLWTRDDLPYSFKFFKSDIGRGCVVYKDEDYPKYAKDTKFRWSTIPYVDLYPCQQGWGTYPECSRKPSKKQRGRTRTIRGVDFPSIDNDMHYLSRWYGTSWTVPAPDQHEFPVNFAVQINAGDPTEPYMNE